MPRSAAVVPDALMAAVVATLDVTAEGGSATEFDRGHGTALCHRERSAVLLTVILPVAAEHIRHLQGAGRHESRSRSAAAVAVPEWG